MWASVVIVKLWRIENDGKMRNVGFFASSLFQSSQDWVQTGWFLIFPSKKKKKKRKETNCMASLEWLWFWSCLWGGRIWAVYKVMTLLVADMKRFSVRLTLSPLKSTCYIQMLLRFPPLCLRAAAYLSDRGRCCGFQSGGGGSCCGLGGLSARTTIGLLCGLEQVNRWLWRRSQSSDLTG